MRKSVPKNGGRSFEGSGERKQKTDSKNEGRIK